jgi:hypothetical protein
MLAANACIARPRHSLAQVAPRLMRCRPGCAVNCLTGPSHTHTSGKRRKRKRAETRARRRRCGTNDRGAAAARIRHESDFIHFVRFSKRPNRSATQPARKQSQRSRVMSRAVTSLGFSACGFHRVYLVVCRCRLRTVTSPALAGWERAHKFGHRRQRWWPLGFLVSRTLSLAVPLCLSL